MPDGIAAQKNAANACARTGREFARNGRDRNHARRRGHPLSEVDEAIAARKHIALQHAVFGERLQHELVQILRRKKTHAALFCPIQNARHVVRHRVRAVRRTERCGCCSEPKDYHANGAIRRDNPIESGSGERPSAHARRHATTRTSRRANIIQAANNGIRRTAPNTLSDSVIAKTTRTPKTTIPRKTQSRSVVV